MSDCLAFVLGGGGARGAMQVGALRALLEAGLKPNLLVGTSIGAANAAGLALWGVDLNAVNALEKAYQDMAASDLMEPWRMRLFLRAFKKISNGNNNHSQRLADFFISRGFMSDLKFKEITDVRLALIGADLETGRPVIYGQDVNESVLDGLLASTALPPWFTPIEKDGHLIMDGGFLCNLPIEPALSLGATKIIALDLDDPRSISNNHQGFYQGLYQFVEKLTYAVSQRYVSLETRLAEAKGVPVQIIKLQGAEATSIWEFSRYQKLIELGYLITSNQIKQWKEANWLDFSQPMLAGIN